MKKVNCIFFKNDFCDNKKVKKSLFGLGARVCCENDYGNKDCEFKVKHQNSLNLEEYSKRNLFVDKSIGISNGLKHAIDKLNSLKHKQNWLIELLEKEYKKSIDIKDEMVKYRDSIKLG